MKFSVIVTTYNRLDALEKVLSGLGCQTVLPGEVIVADDSAQDFAQYLLNDIKNNILGSQRMRK